MKVAVAPEQEESAHPPPLIVMLVVLTVVQFTFSAHVMVTLELVATPVAAFAGVVVLTVGATLSTVTLMPAPGVSTLEDESVALLFML